MKEMITFVIAGAWAGDGVAVFLALLAIIPDQWGWLVLNAGPGRPACYGALVGFFVWLGYAFGRRERRSKRGDPIQP